MASLGFENGQFTRGVAFAADFDFGERGHLRPLAPTFVQRPLAATCGHLPLAATCGHLLPAVRSGHLRPLAANRMAASGCKWLQMTSILKKYWNGLLAYFSSFAESPALYLTVESFLFPLESFLSPLESFLSPLESFLSPLESFLSPLESFLSPLESFLSPLESFLSPLESFLSPLESFLPPLEIPVTATCGHLRPLAATWAQ